MSSGKTEANTSEKEHLEARVVQLTCPMCLQLFSEPVSLPCNHTFCFACLQTMGEGLDQHSCPECQAEYNVTEALQRNLKMCNIIEAYKAAAEKVSSIASPSGVGHVTVMSSDRCDAEESKIKSYQEIEKAHGSLKESSGCEGTSGFKIGSGSSEQPSSIDKDEDEGKMDGPKFRLTSQVKEMSLKLEMAESVLMKEKEHEIEVAIANGELREKVSRLLGRINELSQSYSTQVMQLIEEELGPGEASMSRRVSQAAEMTERLRQAMLRAQSLLIQEDETEFHDELRTLQPHIEELLSKPVGEEEDFTGSRVNPARVCPKLEIMNAELRESFGEIQRSLRNALNPSEVTFDPETAHPNLVLSEDLKTVTFNATKQPYPSSPQRFTSFFQVLSAQSFCEGDHCWEVALEGSPWIIGVCHSGKLARSGLTSALESSQSSWCLMWFNNMLTAFEQSHSVPLKKTTVACRLEIRLSFKTHRLSFYNVSPVSGKTHVYTFKPDLTEPVHLAYRMMSGHPKARATISS